MNKPLSLKDIEAELKRTTKRQGLASHPKSSVWVSANAGTGKTHVLKMRVLRLLLDGTPPEKILCLTYTNAAAAEMATRVFDELSKWVTKDDASLHEEISDLTGETPTQEQLAFARTLFTTAIETPGGLKVQTFHAFCERLLQRFPLEADVSPGFSILDDEQTREVMREAVNRVLSAASDSPESANGEALHELVRYAADERFDDLMSATLTDKGFQKAVAATPTNVNANNESTCDNASNDAAIEKSLRTKLAIQTPGGPDDITDKMANVLDDGTLKRLAHVLHSEGKKTDQNLADIFSATSNLKTSERRAEHFERAFLTGEKKPRARMMTKGISEAHQDLSQAVANAQSTFVKLSAERQGLKKLAVMMALMRLARGVHSHYKKIKARRAALDYDDLIDKTAQLLQGDSATEWVLFKLDNGIDHLLVDESQDTSPQQWQVVETLAKEFFSGYGAQEETKRTIFAVGDEKQSIYSFQGAVPHLFAEKGQQFQTMADAAGEKFSPVDLTLSFRTVSPILRAVDKVFSDPLQAPGVARDGTPVHHSAKRTGQAGLVELWAPERQEETADADPWKPLEEDSTTSPVIRLANRIADTIEGWLREGETLQSQNRPVQAGDILILVRKRHPFANPMVGTLKARGIPVAGADRMVLTDQIAVQDLMALGDFLTLPEDDLALACVLKSPMFGLNDDDLFAIAHGRKGTLWKALLNIADEKNKYTEAANMLRAWRKRADFTPPFEFFSRLLDRDGMRTRFLQRLGTEAADPIDEMLSLALTYDEDAPPSLAGFVTWLRATNRTIKRDMDQGRDEVRVMTVHGAKGLEAPIVFLPDTCSTRTNTSGIRLLPWADTKNTDETTTPGNVDQAPFIWLRKDFETISAVSAAKKMQARGEVEERNRLLYVAMTRARDRLYIAGYHTGKAPDKGCWYEIIKEHLDDMLQEAATADGQPVKRLATDQTVDTETATQLETGPIATDSLPSWFANAAPTEPQLSIPLAPSRLAPYDTDDDGDPVQPEKAQTSTPSETIQSQFVFNVHEASQIALNTKDATDYTASPPTPQDPAALPPTTLADGYRFLRGTLTHALLEHLPAFAQSDQRKAAEAFVARRGGALSDRVRQSIVEETITILQGETFAGLFGPDSRAEVNIAAEIPNPDGNGPALNLSGQIDRLVVEEDCVRIIDYKTNRPPPHKSEDVAEAYLLQLAAYRIAISQIYPNKNVICALLWTDGPRIMEIPEAQIDTAVTKLWTLSNSLSNAS